MGGLVALLLWLALFADTADAQCFHTRVFPLAVTAPDMADPSALARCDQQGELLPPDVHVLFASDALSWSDVANDNVRL